MRRKKRIVVGLKSWSTPLRDAVSTLHRDVAIPAGDSLLLSLQRNLDLPRRASVPGQLERHRPPPVPWGPPPPPPLCSNSTCGDVLVLRGSSTVRRKPSLSYVSFCLNMPPPRSRPSRVARLYSRTVVASGYTCIVQPRASRQPSARVSRRKTKKNQKKSAGKRAGKGKSRGRLKHHDRIKRTRHKKIVVREGGKMESSGPVKVSREGGGDANDVTRMGGSSMTEGFAASEGTPRGRVACVESFANKVLHSAGEEKKASRLELIYAFQPEGKVMEETRAPELAVSVLRHCLRIRRSPTATSSSAMSFSYRLEETRPWATPSPACNSESEGARGWGRRTLGRTLKKYCTETADSRFLGGPWGLQYWSDWVPTEKKKNTKKNVTLALRYRHIISRISLCTGTFSPPFAFWQRSPYAEE